MNADGSLHTPARRARIRLTPRAAVLILVVSALLLYLVVPLRSFIAQRDRLTQLEEQARALERQNSELEEEIRRLYDPEYLERIARECLGMVRPGEIPFVVVPKSGEATPPDC
ncbi:hypothetical protein BH20ACT24_BH20ACT24_11630 [soil metagenome]